MFVFLIRTFIIQQKQGITFVAVLNITTSLCCDWSEIQEWARLIQKRTFVQLMTHIETQKWAVHLWKERERVLQSGHGSVLVFEKV